MRILIIQPWISYRGAESVSLEEAHGLISLGHDVSIMCLFVDRQNLKKEDLSLEFILPNYNLALLLKKFKLFFFIFGFPALLTLLFKKGKAFNIYNPHNFPSNWIAVLVAFFYKKPVFWTVHNFPQHGFNNPLLSGFWIKLTYPLDRFFAKRVTQVICVSEKVRKEVNSLYKRNSKVIYPPVATEFFSKYEKKKVNKIREKLLPNIILVPARLTELKNLFFALETIKKIVIKNKKISFIFLGEGPLMSKLRKFSINNGLNKSVKFLGFVGKEELRNYYKAADLIFLPAFYGEGFNITVLEALCNATPSIVLEGSGVDFWLSKNKVGFVAKENPEQLSKYIIKLIKDKKYITQYGIKGKKLVFEFLKTKNYAQNLIKTFQSVENK